MRKHLRDQTGAMSLVMGFTVISVALAALVVSAVVSQTQATQSIRVDNSAAAVARTAMTDAVAHFEQQSQRTHMTSAPERCKTGTDEGMDWRWCSTARDTGDDTRGSGIDLTVTIEAPGGQRTYTAHLSGAIMVVDSRSSSSSENYGGGQQPADLWMRSFGFSSTYKFRQTGTASVLGTYSPGGSGNVTSGAPVNAVTTHLITPASILRTLTGMPTDRKDTIMTEDGSSCLGPACADTPERRVTWGPFNRQARVGGVELAYRHWSEGNDQGTTCPNPAPFIASKVADRTLRIPASGYICYSHLIFDVNTTITGSGTIAVGAPYRTASGSTRTSQGLTMVYPNVSVNAAATWPDARNVTIVTAGETQVAANGRIAASLVAEQVFVNSGTVYGSIRANDIYADNAKLYWQRELINADYYTGPWMSAGANAAPRWMLFPRDGFLTDFKDATP